MDIVLKNGAKYSGALQTAADNMIIIIGGKVTISIPTSEIKSIMDKDRNITVDLLNKANSVPMIDLHFVQSDDYFVFDEPLVDQEWIYVYLSKCRLHSVRTPKIRENFCLCRVAPKMDETLDQKQTATKNDLKLGTKVIFFDATGNDDTYRVQKTPRNKTVIG